ncbi:hypothetical protein I3843_05G013100 [Carya illinoinensis]|uniref:Uncharacterized protein n=1 Tax=Carya illinoinensis TaxID=32201 RepID=A0A8T1QE76_CARIL|nr:uncharacterized protein LOC122309972 [Carya illinoinensis]KAG6652534.1 hypothetical protein CIPAW_05G013000 [Carya illinoinensis]KAG7977086.1 hypothetical protein I3843_05G013100 [Carya illinoinensis]
MLDIWSWICELSNLDEGDSHNVLELARSGPGQQTQIIQLIAERTSGSNTDTLMTFTICSHGFDSSDVQMTIWVSDACPLFSPQPFLPLLLQLLQELISRSPKARDSTCPRSQLQKLKQDPISWIMESHSLESFSSFFNQVFLMRLFWLCVCDSPSEVGSLYFHSLLAPNIEALSCKHMPVLRTFFISVGVDVEQCFMRTLGYMITKWLILKEVGVGLQTLTPDKNLGFSYATEAHGFWVLKGYAPVLGMKLARYKGHKYRFPVIEAKESLIRYALAHQQLEAVIQFEYSVTFYDGFLHVNTRVDNIRLHVAKLGFNESEDVHYAEERHFPSRIRFWVGPEVGATYVAGVSLGRSTNNGEKEVETQKIVKGSFEKAKVQRVKALETTSTRTRTKNWRWDQDTEGNAAIFDAVLYDDMTGLEAATWNPHSGVTSKTGHGLQNRYTGANRPFTKTGGLVFAGDVYGEGVSWRLSKEMEGSVLKWRIGGQVWLSYLPNEVKSSYFETRCVEWCDEVDLPLIRDK